MNNKSKKSFSTMGYLLKSFSVHLSIFTLLIGPIPLVGKEKSKSEKESDGWKIAQSMLGQFTQTYANAIQSQANMQQQANLLQQLQVTPIRSKFFPNCQLAPMTPKPKGVCDSISDPNTLQMARFYQQMADRNIDMYEKLSRDGGAGKIIGFNQGETYLNNSGISCLRQNQALVDSQLQDKLNYLEGLKAKIEKQSQLFKEQNNKLLNGMRDINSELNGGGNTADDQNRNFANMLKGSKCSEFLPSNILSGKKLGLRGMTDFMEKSGQGGKSLKDQASFMIKDQGKVKKQLENNIKKITDLINRNGLSGINEKMISTINNGAIKFGKSFTDVLGTEVSIHMNNYNAIKNELSEIKDSKGNPIIEDFPTLDRNFTSRISEINPRNKIKNSLIEDCITYNGALKIDQVLANLRHRSLGNKGATIIRLRDELSKVLNSTSAINDSSYIKDKLEAIKKIDDHYGSGKITVKLDSAYFGNNASHGYTPYELFASIYGQCEKKYEAGQLSNGKKQRVENALKRLNDFKNEERSFSSNLANKISDQVLNCANTGEASSGSCSEKSLQTTSDNFCLSHAVSCAQNVNRCYDRINNEITTRVNKIKTFAAQYNNNVEKFIASQEAYYNQLKAQFSRESGVLKNFFQGANFSVIEKDKLFVEMPELSLNKEFGLQMRDPEMNFLQNLPKAINSLKRMMAEQKKVIAKKIEEHINDQKEVLSNNITTWKDIASTCKQSEQSYVAMVNKKNKEMADAYKEQEQATQKFCRNYDSLRRSKVPGCGDDNSISKLMEEGNKIASRIDQDVFKTIGQYKDYCNQYGGDKNKQGTENEEELPIALQLCDPNGSANFGASKVSSNFKDLLADYGIDYQELESISTDSDKYKEMSATKKKLVRYVKQALESVESDTFCEDLREDYDRNICIASSSKKGDKKKCNGKSYDTQGLKKEIYNNGIEKETHPKRRSLELAIKYAKKSSGKDGNALWASIGEQAISDCTANNTTQSAFKNAMSDIMALQKGMMQSKINQ